MPVDVTESKFEDGEVEYGEGEYDPTRHISHFATCPNAAKHRKTK